MITELISVKKKRSNWAGWLLLGTDTWFSSVAQLLQAGSEMRRFSKMLTQFMPLFIKQLPAEYLNENIPI